MPKLNILVLSAYFLIGAQQTLAADQSPTRQDSINQCIRLLSGDTVVETKQPGKELLVALKNYFDLSYEASTQVAASTQTEEVRRPGRELLIAIRNYFDLSYGSEVIGEDGQPTGETQRPGRELMTALKNYFDLSYTGSSEVGRTEQTGEVKRPGRELLIAVRNYFDLSYGSTAETSQPTQVSQHDRELLIAIRNYFNLSYGGPVVDQSGQPTGEVQKPGRELLAALKNYFTLYSTEAVGQERSALTPLLHMNGYRSFGEGDVSLTVENGIKIGPNLHFGGIKNGPREGATGGVRINSHLEHLPRNSEGPAVIKFVTTDTFSGFGLDGEFQVTDSVYSFRPRGEHQYQGKDDKDIIEINVVRIGEPSEVIRFLLIGEVAEGGRFNFEGYATIKPDLFDGGADIRMQPVVPWGASYE